MNPPRWILGEKEETEQEDRDAIARERFKKLSEMIAQSEGNPREGRTQFESSSRGLSLLFPLDVVDPASCQRLGLGRMTWTWTTAGFRLKDLPLPVQQVSCLSCRNILLILWFQKQRRLLAKSGFTGGHPLRQQRQNRSPHQTRKNRTTHPTQKTIGAAQQNQPQTARNVSTFRLFGYICTEWPTAPQFSFDYASIRTSPPSIPQSTQFRTQGRLPTQRSSQSQTRTPQTPAPPPRSQLDTSTTRTPRNKPSTSHQASPARTSQGRQSAPRRTQDPITPSQAGPRSSQGNAGASRECLTTQSTPSLTNNSPKSRHADIAAQGSGETPGSYSRQRTILGLAPH